MPATHSLFSGKGGAVAIQLLTWQVLGQILGAVMGPITQGLQQNVYKLITDTPLSPEQCAELVIRGWMTQQQGQEEAVLSGVGQDRFQQLINMTGEPLALEQLLFLLRRGDADLATVEHGIRESRVRDEWIPYALKLQHVPLSPADAVNAVVRGQISFDAGAAQAWLSGINREDFQQLVNTTGNPPSPGELLTLYRRGEIPMEGTGTDMLSVQQGIYEGDSKNKWWRHIAELATVYPPPRTVMAMLRAGAISDARARELMTKAGLDSASIANYIAEAHSGKLTTAKNLAESTVLDLYEAHAVTEVQAQQFLTALGYTEAERNYLLSLRDVLRTLHALNAAVSKIGALYVARKIGAQTVQHDLAQLELAPDHIAQLLQYWSLEREATTRLLTEAQIVDAYEFRILDQGAAQQALEDLGYTAQDAWVLLSIKHKAPLPGAPAASGNVGGEAP